MDSFRRTQNVLEPLSAIYGVPKVSVENGCKDMAVNIGKAVVCKQKAVLPRVEDYKIRMVSVKGRGRKKQPRRYCTSKYDDSKFIWNTELSGPLRPPQMNMVLFGSHDRNLIALVSSSQIRHTHMDGRLDVFAHL